MMQKDASTIWRTKWVDVSMSKDRSSGIANQKKMLTRGSVEKWSRWSLLISWFYVSFKESWAIFTDRSIQNRKNGHRILFRSLQIDRDPKKSEHCISDKGSKWSKIDHLFLLLFKPIHDQDAIARDLSSWSRFLAWFCVGVRISILKDRDRKESILIIGDHLQDRSPFDIKNLFFS